jgi:starvation-inducible outer membrane lipoprotein
MGFKPHKLGYEAPIAMVNNGKIIIRTNSLMTPEGMKKIYLPFFTQIQGSKQQTLDRNYTWKMMQQINIYIIWKAPATIGNIWQPLVFPTKTSS